MRKETIHCDGPNCTNVKGSANRWLIGQKMSGPSDPDWGYAIGPWNDNLVESTQHFCGQSCALARLNEFLEAKQ